MWRDSMELMQKHATDCEIRGFCRTTVSTYKGYIRHYLENIQDPLNVSRDELRHVMRQLADKEYSASSYKGYWAAVDDFYKFLQYEDITDYNPVPRFRERYLPRVINIAKSEQRQCIDLAQMRQLIDRSHNIVELTMMLLLAKTGIRRGELLDIEKKDVDLDKRTIRLQPKRKRSRDIVFMDEELAQTFQKYFTWWNDYSQSKYLFLNKYQDNKMTREMPNQIIQHHGYKLGLHNPDPDAHLDEKLSCHCFRHFFTTQLYEAGMSPEHIKYLRGDSLTREAWQIYLHIDPEQVKKEYERCIPSLL